MKNKKGFTLVELLAIIVILAIIAIIAVPIILNMIEEAKKGAFKSSANGYKDAVQKYYASNLTLNPTFRIPNNIYTPAQLKLMGVAVNGREPEGSSWVEINNNKVVEGCLEFDEYKVIIINGSVTDAEKGTCGVETNGENATPIELI